MKTSPTTPGRIVVIPCGGTKLDRNARAGDMYTGSYHKACRRAADALVANGGRVLILSALYGLLELDDVISPYDKRMGQAGSVKADQLRAQAYVLRVDQAADVIVLGGRKYVEAAAAVWPHARRPLDGCTGMGKQLTRLAAIARGELDVDAPAPAPAADEKQGGRPATGETPSRSVRVGAAWDLAQAKARRADYPFADVVDELLTAWTDGKVATLPDIYPFTLDQVADQLGAPREDVDVLVGQIADSDWLYHPETGRLSETGRDVIASAWCPPFVTVEIGARTDDVDRLGRYVYQAVAPAETWDVAESGWEGQAPQSIADGMVAILARDPHSITAGGPFRVRLWSGKDADTSSKPTAESYHAATAVPAVLGCGARPTTARIEVYSPSGGRAHGSLDATANLCEQHESGAVETYRRAGFTTHRTDADNALPCGYWVDFTGELTEWHDPDRDGRFGVLTDYATGAEIRPATGPEHARSLAAGETGAFDLDGRAVFVAGGPEQTTTAAG